MKPGIYEGISNADYHGGPGISISGLKLFQRSPLHYWSTYHDPNRPEREDSKAFRLGTAIHAAVLEPDAFAATYKVAPQCDRRTKEGKAIAAAFEAECGPDTVILPPDEFAAVEAIAAQVKRHPMASNIMAQGAPEVSVYWEDVETGVLCRCRPDWLAPGIILDVKSTEDASPWEFQRTIVRYGYHLQAAWYMDGLHAAGQSRDAFVFMAVEKSRPHAVALYYADQEMLDFGRAEYRRLLDQYARCSSRNEWPGYPPVVSPIGLPLWMQRAANDNQPKGA